MLDSPSSLHLGKKRRRRRKGRARKEREIGEEDLESSEDSQQGFDKSVDRAAAPAVPRQPQGMKTILGDAPGDGVKVTLASSSRLERRRSENSPRKPF